MGDTLDRGVLFDPMTSYGNSDGCSRPFHGNSLKLPFCFIVWGPSGSLTCQFTGSYALLACLLMTPSLPSWSHWQQWEPSVQLSCEVQLCTLEGLRCALALASLFVMLQLPKLQSRLKVSSAWTKWSISASMAWCVFFFGEDSLLGCFVGWQSSMHQMRGLRCFLRASVNLEVSCYVRNLSALVPVIVNCVVAVVVVDIQRKQWLYTMLQCKWLVTDLLLQDSREAVCPPDNYE